MRPRSHPRPRLLGLLCLALTTASLVASPPQEQGTKPAPRATGKAPVLPEATEPLAKQRIALVGASVIDGTGRPPQKGWTVLLDGERIAEVGPDVAVPEGARVVDL